MSGKAYDKGGYTDFSQLESALEQDRVDRHETLFRVAQAADRAWVWIRHLEDEGDHTHAGLEDDLKELREAVKAMEYLFD